MKLLIAYGSLGKFFHLKEFGETLKKMGIEYFELMQKEFDTNCLSYLGNVSEDEFVNQCLKIDYKKIK